MTDEMTCELDNLWHAEAAVQTNPGDIMAHAVLRRIKQEMGEPPH